MKDDDAGDGDPIAAWLAVTAGDATGDAPDAAAAAPPRQRAPLPRRLLLLSVLPWVAVALLGATALQGRSSGNPAAVAPSPTPTSGEEAVASAPVAPGVGGETAADAAAVVAVRVGAGDDEYIDTAAVESRASAGPLTIVTVRAVRLVRSAGAWSEPQVIRAAVATGEVDGEIVAVGPPWRLPPPASASAPAWKVVDDAALLTTATATLRATGYRRLGPAQLRRAAALGDVVSLALTAAAPGDADVRPYEILMSPDATAVLGTSAAEPLPLPVPAEQP